jgi:hypothetical protein
MRECDTTLHVQQQHVTDMSSSGRVGARSSLQIVHAHVSDTARTALHTHKRHHRIVSESLLRRRCGCAQ